MLNLQIFPACIFQPMWMKLLDDCTETSASSNFLDCSELTEVISVEKK